MVVTLGDSVNNTMTPTSRMDSQWLSVSMFVSALIGVI
jgi:hypothetical protein